MKTNYTQEELQEIVKLLIKEDDLVNYEEVGYNDFNHKDSIFVPMINDLGYYLIFDEDSLEDKVNSFLMAIKNNDFMFELDYDNDIFDGVENMGIKSLIMALNDLCKDDGLKVNSVVSSYIKREFVSYELDTEKYKGKFYVKLTQW